MDAQCAISHAQNSVIPDEYESLAGHPVPPGLRFGERVRFGVLTHEITPETVDEAIERAGCREKRRRLLPARSTMYFILALCLFSSAESAAPPGYRAVLRTLTEKLRHLPGWAVQHLPSSSALTRARQRLGTKPLQILFESRCGHLATAASGSSFAFGLRLTAWDGTALDVPKTPETAERSATPAEPGST